MTEQAVSPAASMPARPVSAAIADSTWSDWLHRHPEASFLQSAAWAETRAEQGWRIVRIIVEGAGVQVLVRRTPLGDFGYAPRGPIADPADLAGCRKLRAALRAKLGPRTVAVRFEPPWLDSGPLRSQLAAWDWRAVEATQPPSTVLIDLTGGSDALLAAMKQKWRYNIRLAAKHGVTVRPGHGDLDDARFGQLIRETAARDGFHARPAAYYAAVRRAFAGDGHLLIAEHGEDVLAAILVVHAGDTATYLYGASASRGRELMPNHLLQWRAMTQAIEAGLKTYDLWGIPDRLGQAAVAGRDPDQEAPGHGGLWGVWGFKRGFGGRVVRYAGAWDEVYGPVRYRLARWWEAARRRSQTDEDA